MTALIDKRPEQSGRLLTDSFGRRHDYLRVSVTASCNLHCSYCYPSTGYSGGNARRVLGTADIMRLVRLFAALGVRKVRFTGGEPLMRPDIAGLIRETRGTGGIEKVGLTTNGVLLSGRVGELREAGLELLNVSLDTLRPDRFRRITGRNRFAAVMRGLQAAMAAGFEKVKINVVVVRGVNDDELAGFVGLCREWPVELRFIEYMPFRSNLWRNEDFVSWDEMRERIEHAYNLRAAFGEEPVAGVARSYRVPGFEGTLGFITPLSAKFCRSCSRLRLTADGKLKVCLYNPRELDLARLLGEGASDERISEELARELRMKPLAHAAGEKDPQQREMVETGG